MCKYSTNSTRVGDDGDNFSDGSSEGREDEKVKHHGEEFEDRGNRYPVPRSSVPLSLELSISPGLAQLPKFTAPPGLPAPSWLRAPPGLSSASLACSIPSVGSAMHGTGNCKPCVWFWKANGCKNGQDCCHCHVCPEGEKRTRKKAKRQCQKQQKELLFKKAQEGQALLATMPRVTHLAPTAYSATCLIPAALSPNPGRCSTPLANASLASISVHKQVQISSHCTHGYLEPTRASTSPCIIQLAARLAA